MNQGNCESIGSGNQRCGRREDSEKIPDTFFSSPIGGGIGAAGGLNVGYVWGKGVHRPEDYSGWFINTQKDVATGPVGGYGGFSFAPQEGDKPVSGEGGLSFGLGVGVALTVQGQYYHLQICCDVE